MDERDTAMPSDGGERRDAVENRLRLLAAAKQLFAAQGAEATSMREVARRAGVGQGTLYRHFADKSALCQGLIKEDITAFQTRLDAIIGGTGGQLTPLARLDLLLTERLRLTDSHLPLFAIMEQTTGASRGHKPFRGPFYSWTHVQVVALLQQAIASGEVAALDADFVADAILATLAPPLFAYQRQERGYSVERIAAELRRLFIDGLRAQRKRSAISNQPSGS